LSCFITSGPFLFFNISLPLLALPTLRAGRARQMLGKKFCCAGGHPPLVKKMLLDFISLWPVVSPELSSIIIPSVSFQTISMSSRENGQPSLLDYARFHGLAIDHLHQDILSLLPSDVLTCDEDATLPEFRLPDLDRLPPEPKFQLNSKAASLLASSIRPPPAPHWANTLPDHHKVKKLKLEQPLLRTDHEKDMERIRYPKPTRIGAMNLVPIEVDEDRGEGFAWPQETIDLAAVWDKDASQEKLQTTREVLKTLQDALRPVYTAQMHEEIMAEGSNFTRVCPSRTLGLVKSDSE
jgi:hypothetical protein